MPHLRIALAIIPVLSLGLSSCALDPKAAGDAPKDIAESPRAIPQIQTDPQLAQLVPAEVRDAGLQVATAGKTPPMTYLDTDNKTPIGFDVDMAVAIGEVLGLETDVRAVGFDTVIPGLAARRYTIALSSLGVTEERLKTVDFVNYYRGGQGFLAAADTEFAVSDLRGLCGRRVAVQSGSVQESSLQKENLDLCGKAGLEPWEVQVFPDNNASVLAIRSGRTEVLYASISVISYTAKRNKQVRVAGRYQRTTVGVALAKGAPMTPVVQKAVQKLIDDGTYAKLLQKWGLEENAIQSAEVNSILQG